LAARDALRADPVAARLFFAVTSVTSMGSAGLPEMFAWAFAASRLLRRDVDQAEPAVAVQPVRG
jgi:hypothetical protein